VKRPKECRLAGKSGKVLEYPELVDIRKKL
jgi:hypothetical protein